MAVLTLYPSYISSGAVFDAILSANGTGEDYRTINVGTANLDVGEIAFSNAPLRTRSKANVFSSIRLNFEMKNGNTFATSGLSWNITPRLFINPAITGNTITVSNYRNLAQTQEAFTRDTDYSSKSLMFASNESDIFGVAENYPGFYLSCHRDTSLVKTQAYMKNLTATVTYNPRFYARFYDDSGNLISETAYNANEAVAVPSAPSKAGFVFAGWRSNKGDVFYFPSMEIPSGYDTDIGFTAVYNEITYSVSNHNTDKFATKIEVFENGQWVEKTESRYREGTKIRVSVKSMYGAGYDVQYIVGSQMNPLDWDGFDIVYETDSLDENVIIQYVATEVRFDIERAFAGSIENFSGNFTVQRGSDAEYTITVKPNAYINQFTVNGADKLDELIPVSDTEFIYQLQNVQADTELYVSAIRNDKTVTKITDGHGTISGADVSVLGESNTFTITPDYRYRIADVLLDGVSVMEELTFADGYATFDLFDLSPSVAPYRLEARFREVVYATFNSGENGSIIGDLTIDKGDSASFEISADEGYSVDNVRAVVGNDEQEYQATLAQESYSLFFDELNSDIDIYASFTDDISTIAVEAVQHGSIYALPGDYINGTQLNIEAVADEGYYFESWEDGSTENPRTLTVTEDLEISADFGSFSYNITADVPEGHGHIEPGSIYANYGDTVTLRAIPDSGYKLKQWSDDVLTAEREITVMGDASYSAEFEKDSFSLSVSTPEGGTVTGSGTYLFGSQVTVTATPSVGYYFLQWSDGSAYSTREVTIPAENISLTAEFKKYEYSVSVEAGEGGRANESAVVEYGDDFLLTVTADTGFQVADVILDGVSVFEDLTLNKTGGTFVIPNIHADHTVKIVFGEKLYRFGRKMLDYYPPVLQRILEIQALMKAQEPIIGEAWDDISFVTDNQFIDTATDEGVKKWENELNIIPNVTDTLRQRKERLKLKWVPAPCYTMPWLVSYLQMACGKKDITLPYVDGYVLHIGLPSTCNYREIFDDLRRYVPANIIISRLIELQQSTQQLAVGNFSVWLVTITSDVPNIGQEE